MEKLIITFFTAFLIGYSGNAQPGYEEQMKTALELRKDHKTAEALAIFEELAETGGDNWLPYYYASEIKISEAFPVEDPIEKEQRLLEAQEMLDKAKMYGGEGNVELMLLQALLHTGYITLDPPTYGQVLLPKIEGIYEKAYDIAPGNPRLALAKAEWKMGKAPYFGEDPSIYCDDLKASLPLFEEERAAEPFWPSWGEERAKMLIAKMCGEE